MIEFFLDLFGFFLKSLIIAFLVVTPLLLIALIMRRKDKSLDQKDGLKIVVKDLRQGMIKRRDNMRKVLKKHHPDKDIEDLNPITKKLKRKHKDADEEDDFQKAKQKREAYLQELKEKEAEGIFCPKNLFVLNFNGGSKGSEVKRLRKEIDALLDVATPKDEVIVNLTSPGGMVNSYGLLSSQLARIRQKNINLVWDYLLKIFLFSDFHTIKDNGSDYLISVPITILHGLRYGNIGILLNKKSFYHISYSIPFCPQHGIVYRAYISHFTKSEFLQKMKQIHRQIGHFCMCMNYLRKKFQIDIKEPYRKQYNT